MTNEYRGIQTAGISQKSPKKWGGGSNSKLLQPISISKRRIPSEPKVYPVLQKEPKILGLKYPKLKRIKEPQKTSNPPRTQSNSLNNPSLLQTVSFQSFQSSGSGLKKNGSGLKNTGLGIINSESRIRNSESRIRTESRDERHYSFNSYNYSTDDNTLDEKNSVIHSLVSNKSYDEMALVTTPSGQIITNTYTHNFLADDVTFDEYIGPIPTVSMQHSFPAPNTKIMHIPNDAPSPTGTETLATTSVFSATTATTKGTDDTSTTNITTTRNTEHCISNELAEFADDDSEISPEEELIEEMEEETVITVATPAPVIALNDHLAAFAEEEIPVNTRNEDVISWRKIGAQIQSLSQSFQECNVNMLKFVPRGEEEEDNEEEHNRQMQTLASPHSAGSASDYSNSFDEYQTDYQTDYTDYSLESLPVSKKKEQKSGRKKKKEVEDKTFATGAERVASKLAELESLHASGLKKKSEATTQNILPVDEPRQRIANKMGELEVLRIVELNKKLEELGLSNVRMTEKGEIVSTVTNAIINDDFTKKEKKNGQYTSTKEKGESKEESLLKNISKLRKRLSVL
mmetsp:Transcript_7534/g.15631  ORF Transcript_7534/g.15631 Transcript_7534/m.15631 type:complete len:573 (-) Transcript_7534:99-1817(-)